MAKTERKEDTIQLRSLLLTRQFLIPVLLSGFAWAIMTVPMSMLRPAMHELGYTARQSLTTIEIHFLGMYSPGFVTGRLIQRYGPKRVCAAAALIFGVSLVFMLLADSEEDGSIAVWIIGLFLVGVGWNFGFTGATVWTTALYKKAPMHKEKVQAANDSIMFLIAGAWIVSASYIFEAGGSGLDGWRTLNKVVVGLLGVYVAVVVVDKCLDTAIKGEAGEGTAPT
jgi:MFS family permease